MNGNDDSFVNVGGESQDFVIKVGIQENGARKYHRLVVNNSNATLDHLKEFLDARTAGGKGEFTYHDVDGDLCVITKTADLLDAMKQFKEKGSLKLETSPVEGTRGARLGNSAPSAPVTPNPSTPLSYQERVARARQRPQEPVQEEDVEQRRRQLQALEEANPEEIRHHVLEEFQDHFNLDHPREFFASEDLSENEVGVMTKYQLNDRPVKSAFFCMDDVYLDLTTGPHPDRENLVRMAIPIGLLENIADQVTSIVPGSSSGSLSCSIDRSLHPIVVEFDPSIHVHYMLEDNLTRVAKGALGDLVQDEEYQHFYKVSAVFTATAMKDTGSLALTIVDLVAFSHEDDLLDALMGDCDCGSEGTWNLNYGFPEEDDPAFEEEDEFPGQFF